MIKYESLLQKVYAAFNARDIENILTYMQPDVHWPNGWEGGYVEGHEAVKDYWTRQWAAIDPHVYPISFQEMADGRIMIDVHQVVKDLRGNLLSDGRVKHMYTFTEELIQGMEIMEVRTSQQNN